MAGHVHWRSGHMEREGTDPAPVTDTVRERLTLSQLRTFCELARLGTSMTEAAARLKRTQPWVSRQMTQLEAEIAPWERA